MRGVVPIQLPNGVGLGLMDSDSDLVDGLDLTTSLDYTCTHVGGEVEPIELI